MLMIESCKLYVYLEKFAYRLYPSFIDTLSCSCVAVYMRTGPKQIACRLLGS